ncbi:AraC family transcriptional regulator [Streptomyces malaysiense]|uniref:AraC family transcriptional regulator n=1 Tax=Streptomyces malaysiense TaxID=1428626 RepID=UPI0009A0F183|nr:AraC family transcriptional regulator [Streptomyces malaysiense]
MPNFDDLPSGSGDSDPALLYQGANIEQLHQVVTDRFSSHRLAVTGAHQIQGRFRCFHDGRIALYELGYGADVRVHTGELPTFYNIQLPVAGDGTVMVNDAPLKSTLCIAGPGDRLSMNWNSEAVNNILIFPFQEMEKAVVRRLGDLPSGGLRFNNVLDERNPVMRSWIKLARSFSLFSRSPLSHSSHLGMRHFENALVDSILDVQPHSWSSAIADRGPAILPNSLRRATNFCAEHANEPISVSDIAQAARVSVRTLREGFRAHLGTSPLAYLRSVRLDHAHRDLVAVARGQAAGTVTDIACRWGFTHLGRFSADYRRAYGQSPSQTLRHHL